MNVLAIDTSVGVSVAILRSNMLATFQFMASVRWMQLLLSTENLV